MAIDSGSVDMSIVFAAAEKGDYKRVREIIEYTGTNLTRDEEGRTLLHYAVLSGNVDEVEYLVERCSFSPFDASFSGVTPYDVAVREKKAEILSYFSRMVPEDGTLYHNPIRRGFFPDPSVIRVGDDSYMVNSTFHFFPAIPISHSKDLVNWKVIGYAITNPEWSRLSDKDGGRGYWAPDISYSDGRFYITATLRMNEGEEEKRIQMVTSSPNPEGPYDEPSWIHEDGIDPSIFHDSDGRKYMLLNRGARIFRLSPDCRQKESEPVLLWLGECHRSPEGPHILKKDGWYYLFLAEGGTGEGHRVTCARSHSLMGPYEACPHNPILRQYDEKALLQCTGHGCLVDTPEGDWYMAYLTLRRDENGYGFTGRETALSRVTWDSDGWPVVDGGKAPLVSSFAPKAKEGAPSFSPDLVYPAWKDRVWMTPRPLERERVWEENGSLFLKGDSFPPFSKEKRSILLMRQEEFDFSLSLSFPYPDFLKEGESMGTISYYDENSFILFGVGIKDGKSVLELKMYGGDEYTEEKYLPLSPSPIITLGVEARGNEREFGNGKERLILHNTSILASEGLRKGKRFTGATIGVYAHGDFTAEFSDWKIDFVKKD
ncbi:MAG: family 43 glycosylhydrolase [Candidatus Ornithospirochaeta sp.]